MMLLIMLLLFFSAIPMQECKVTDFNSFLECLKQENVIITPNVSSSKISNFLRFCTHSTLGLSSVVVGSGGAAFLYWWNKKATNSYLSGQINLAGEEMEKGVQEMEKALSEKEQSHHNNCQKNITRIKMNQQGLVDLTKDIKAARETVQKATHILEKMHLNPIEYGLNLSKEKETMEIVVQELQKRDEDAKLLLHGLKVNKEELGLLKIKIDSIIFAGALSSASTEKAEKKDIRRLSTTKWQRPARTPTEYDKALQELQDYLDNGGDSTIRLPGDNYSVLHNATNSTSALANIK